MAMDKYELYMSMYIYIYMEIHALLYTKTNKYKCRLLVCTQPCFASIQDVCTHVETAKESRKKQA
jgi:hypothetical protein